MPCYYPILAAQAAPGEPLQLFHREQKHLRDAVTGKHLEVPCGQCSGCRRRRSLEWAVRCMHEKQTHRYNCFITLTYDDHHLPPNGSLDHRHWQLFLKKLRNLLSRKKDHGLISMPSGGKNQHEHTIRFYMCGEYGEKYGRPHYHALLFGVDFTEKLLHKTTPSGEKIYVSPTLQKLWKHGFSSIGEVTFNSAAYISRYVMKKRTGDGERKYYKILDLETGEIIDKQKEYNCMSRRPGIAAQWWSLYNKDVTTQDKVVTRSGRILRPPRYYDKLLKRHDRALLEGHKHARELQALAKAHEHTPERLAVQEIVATAQAQHQRRNLS